jgi:hypothetical protein
MRQFRRKSTLLPKIPQATKGCRQFYTKCLSFVSPQGHFKFSALRFCLPLLMLTTERAKYFMVSGDFLTILALTSFAGGVCGLRKNTPRNLRRQKAEWEGRRIRPYHFSEANLRKDILI